jgi:polyhydroxyalkanoate synthesis regulator phasin
MTQAQVQHIDMQEFCSSKLWEMVSEDTRTSADDLEAAIEELARRRHYLAELEQLGKLRAPS